jgi:hypothetical protein
MTVGRMGSATSTEGACAIELLRVVAIRDIRTDRFGSIVTAADRVVTGVVVDTRVVRETALSDAVIVAVARGQE